MSAALNIHAPGHPVYIETDDGQRGTLDANGHLRIETADGGLLIKTAWKRKGASSTRHTANLAVELERYALGMLADDLLRGIEADDQSRAEYLETIADAVSMLGLRQDQPGSASDDAAPVDGMSRYKHPMLLKSSLRFQADFVAEMLPADGPVKVRSDAGNPPPGLQTPAAHEDDLAMALEKDFNHYLTAIATEYYPDTTRMAFKVGMSGCGFKKGYHHPIWKRPTLESVDSNDLIVSNATTDIGTALRVTHRIHCYHAELRRLVRSGVYRDIDFVTPTETPDAVDVATADAAGIAVTPTLPGDHRHTLYECYTDLDLPGFEDPDGNYLPYKITIDKDSREILEIRRNWRADDKLKRRRRTFVKYPYVDALWFYSIGLMHILGNTTRALTAIYREMIDSGMFANFPGFLYSTGVGRQDTNLFRVPPGGGQGLDTGGKPITDSVMPLPYKSLDAAFLQFAQHVEQVGMDLGGAAEVPVSEGAANMPVGTMLAMVEQALKPIQGVFKGLHRAQAEEFQILKELFTEDPEAFWRYNEKPSHPWDETTFIAALKDANLVPMADPNTASQVQRIVKASAVFELAKTAPMLFEQRDVALRLMRMVGIEDAESLLSSPAVIAQRMAASAPPAAGGKAPNPALDAANAQKAQAQAGLAQAQTQAIGQDMQTKVAGMSADLQDKAQERQARASELLVESEDRAADRKSHLEIAQMRQQDEARKLAADSQRMQTDQQGKAAAAHVDLMKHASEQQMKMAQIGADVGKHHVSAAANAQQAGADAVNTALEGQRQRDHEVKIAGMAPPKRNTP